MSKKGGFFDIDTTEDETDASHAAVQPNSGDSVDLSSKKQFFLIFLCAAALIALFLIVRNIYYSDTSDSSYYPDSWLNTGTNDRVPVYKYYDPDWESDILNDPDYTALKGDIFYAPNDSEMFSVGKEEYLNKGGKGLLFMANYVNAVIAGDHETLNKMFTDSFLKENGLYEDFTEQRLYDIKIKKYHYANPKYENSNIKDEYYIITYKIDRNDGLFRDDIGQEGELAQLFEVFIFDDGTVLADNIISLPGYIS